MLYQQDTRTFVKTKPDDFYDLIILDPPYGKIHTDVGWDHKTFDFTIEYLYNIFRILKPTGSLYLHCGIGEKSQSMIEWFNQFKTSKFYFKQLVTWKKNRGIGMIRGWLFTREEILWYVKDNTKFIWNKENQYSDEKRAFDIIKAGGEKVNKSDFKRLTNIWEDIFDINEIGYGKSPKTFKDLKDKISHITPKSPLLSNRFLRAHCKEGDNVYIGFAGSGMEILSCNYNKVNWDATETDSDCIKFINEVILNNTIKFEEFI